MSKHTDDLKAKWQDAEGEAQKLMADKDQAIGKVHRQYRTKLQKANQDAAKAQSEYLDAEAAEALLDRPDGQAVADSLGLKLPG